MIKRFIKYSIVGVSTFLFDLLLLYIFTDLFLINYLFSAFLAFIIAVSLNYILSRKNVFKGTTRGLKSGYVFFFAIVTVGLVIMLTLMYLLVDLLLVNILFARILVAGLVGIFNFILNDRLNFKM